MSESLDLHIPGDDDLFLTPEEEIQNPENNNSSISLKSESKLKL